MGFDKADIQNKVARLEAQKAEALEKGDSELLANVQFALALLQGILEGGTK